MMRNQLTGLFLFTGLMLWAAPSVQAGPQGLGVEVGLGGGVQYADSRNVNGISTNDFHDVGPASTAFVNVRMGSTGSVSAHFLNQGIVAHTKNISSRAMVYALGTRLWMEGFYLGAGAGFMSLDLATPNSPPYKNRIINDFAVYMGQMGYQFEGGWGISATHYSLAGPGYICSDSSTPQGQGCSTLTVNTTLVALTFTLNTPDIKALTEPSAP